MESVIQRAAKRAAAVGTEPPVEEGGPSPQVAARCPHKTPLLVRVKAVRARGP